MSLLWWRGQVSRRPGRLAGAAAGVAVAVGLLGVVKNIVAAPAIHEKKHRAVIKKRDAELLAKPVGVNFRLARPIAAAIAGTEQVDVRLPKELVIRREAHVVVATGTHR